MTLQIIWNKIKTMKKETAKQKIQKHLWNWKYSVKDADELAPGLSFDLFVKVNKDSDIGYKVKILTGDEDMNIELTRLEEERALKDLSRYEVIALVSGSKKKFAGGDQVVAIFTTKHQEVFK